MCWAHSHFVGCVMRRLTFSSSKGKKKKKEKKKKKKVAEKVATALI